ncbi:MAG: rhomboid family intramembrane serine protease [Chlorobi bacterium]|nr:rhomboid family intramembrane serine protease [Chlorobiota bacterium]
MTEEKTKFIRSLYLPVSFVLLITIIKVVEVIFGYSFIPFGLYPRTLHGLLGIITSPLIHANFDHLYSNAIPLLVLGVSINYFYQESSKKVFLISYFLTETLVWIFARGSYHIGASGIVYALVSFLFFSGIIKKDKRAITLSLLVVFLYGGLAYGVFPVKEGISWESHLLGGLVGIFMAFLFKKKDIYKRYDWEDEELEEDVKNLEVSYKKGYQADSEWKDYENSSR